LQPDPFPKVFNYGSEEAISKSRSQAQAAPGHRSLLTDTFNRRRQPIQHDYDPGHIRDGIAVLIRSQAIAVIASSG
jgi:hypothetical protein